MFADHHVSSTFYSEVDENEINGCVQKNGVEVC